MTKFSIRHHKQGKPVNEKYVTQTYELLCDVNANLENIAIQISQLPIREQNKFLRLLINYVEMVANHKDSKYPPVGLSQAIELCSRIMLIVNEYYEEQDLIEMGASL
jgi:hypothetical protein